METWHYVAIGAVVVVAGVVYYRRRNRAAAAAVAAAPARYAGLASSAEDRAAAAARFARRDVSQRINYNDALSVTPEVKAPGMGAGGAVELSRSLY
jgi:hypothetical protein